MILIPILLGKYFPNDIVVNAERFNSELDYLSEESESGCISFSK